MRVSVLIVSYRTPDLTYAAVRSAADVRQVGEVIIVDNASGDDTVARLRTIDDPRIRVIAHGRNDGFGTAHNAATAVASCEVLLLLNSDAVLNSQAVTYLSEVLAEENYRAIVAPRLVESDGRVQRSAGLLPRPSDLIVRMLGLHTVGRWMTALPVVGRRVRRSRLAREYASSENATGPIDTDMVSGACLAIGREAFEEIGGFDQRFFMYFEDADLCRRAAAAGMPIRYVPGAVVTHIGGASSSEDYHFGPLHARSMRQYLGKWYGPGGSVLAIALLWLRAIGLSVAIRPGARRAWRALWAAVRDEDPRR